MNRFYLMLFVFVLATLAVALAHFFMGLADSSYLISNGFQLRLQYKDAHRYLANLQGLVFALSFLVATGLMGVFVLLPNQNDASLGQGQAPQPLAMRHAPNWVSAAFQATQPNQHALPSAQQANPQAVATVTAPDPATPTSAAPLTAPNVTAPGATAAPPQAATPSAENLAPAIQASPAAENGLSSQMPPPPADTPTTNQDNANTTAQDHKMTGTQLEQHLQQETTTLGEDDDEEFDPTVKQHYHPPSDVVYGNGPITSNALWSLICDHPESAVKFLFRKTLADKSLSPQDEAIYGIWESRGMTRNRVRRIFLEIMDLPALPNDYPHAIWRRLCEDVVTLQQQEERKQLRKQADTSIITGFKKPHIPDARTTLERPNAS